MGMTYAQAKACGIEHLWPTGGEAKVLPDVPQAPSRFTPDGMNKSQRELYRRMRDAGSVFSFVGRESITLRLAGRTRYTPDFFTGGTLGLACWEFKGHMRDDAAVKLKVAAEMYPFFRFILVTRERRAWICRDVTSRGISRDPYTPGWLL